MASKIPSWIEITKMLEVRGWVLAKSGGYRKEFRRGSERLIVFRTAENLWKADYFVGKHLDDSTGAYEDEKFTRLLALEIGVLK